MFRKIKSSNSLELDERAKQERANKLYEEKTKADLQGNKDLAGKLAREYKVQHSFRDSFIHPCVLSFIHSLIITLGILFIHSFN